MPNDGLQHRLTTIAGFATAGFGGAHLALALHADRRRVTGLVRDGWWDTVRLRGANPAERERSSTFWWSIGSFGAPMVLLGAGLVSSGRNRRPAPRWVGWGLLAWGVPTATVLPRSPAWAIPAIGALLVAAGRTQGEHNC